MYQYHLNSLDATRKMGEKISERLSKGGNLLLYGDLGSGKTALTQIIAEFLNIKQKVKSPTFTLLNVYPLPNGRQFFHFDLYRLNTLDEILELGYEEIISNPRNTVVIEWAERITAKFKPDERLDVFLKILGEKERLLELDFVRPQRLSKTMIDELLDEFLTPQNVRRHSEMVAKVAMTLGEKLVGKQEIVHLGLLYEAAMLHDILRLVDFNELKREDVAETVSDDKWQKWQELRAKFQGRNHAEAAQEILNERGYAEISGIIRKHCTSCILQRKKEEELITWEDKLLYYADKRVKNDRIVTLAERFAIGRMQDSRFLRDLKKSLEVEEKAKILEQEIFAACGGEVKL